MYLCSICYSNVLFYMCRAIGATGAAARKQLTKLGEQAKMASAAACGLMAEASLVVARRSAAFVQGSNAESVP